MPINHEIPREERKKKRETCLSEQQFPPPLVKFTSNSSMTTSMTAENLDKEKDRFRRLAESSVSLTTPFQIAKEGKEVSSEWSNLRQCNEILRERHPSLLTIALFASLPAALTGSARSPHLSSVD